MNLNDKMETYLWKQLEDQREAIDKLFERVVMVVNPDKELVKLCHDVMKHFRYIDHAIREAHDCEHCKESGLVD